MLNYSRLREKKLNVIEVIIGVVFCCIPLFITFPYKINLYLAWEGAYRISIGQLPFRDFGMPLGYGFWVIPALFFKIFGPFMSSLIKAQVLINAISLVALSSIFRTFKVSAPIRVLGIIFFCLSYVFINFWPWYNHTVFVYEMVGLAFLFSGLLSNDRFSNLKISVAGAFIFISIFTKQDIGGLGLLVTLTVLVINNLLDREFKRTSFFILGFVVCAAVVVIPLFFYEFKYWFNYGQAPHSSRIALFDYLDETFSVSSITLRLYLLAISIVVIGKISTMGWKSLLADRTGLMFMLFTLAIVVQVLLAQVTTYIPASTHYYYHSIVFVFLLSQMKSIEAGKPWVFISLLILILFVWSHDYWRYGKRVVQRTFGVEQEAPDYNFVNKRTWIFKDQETPSDRTDWKRAPFESLDNVYLPQETIDGITRLKEKWEGKENLTVLNMSELTQLAYELGYTPLAGIDQPLWFHRNVAFFDRESKRACDQISNKEFDIILFETIPRLNRFYPPEVRTCAQEHYILADKFLAPRVPQDSYIEVYVRKDDRL